MAGGVGGYGQGGLPNYYPGRGYRQQGNDYHRDMPNDWVGGARGPAALPSRTTVPNGPTPMDPRIGRDTNGIRWSTDRVTFDGTGAQGPISFHRGIMVEDAGAPRLCFDNVLGHGTIPWSRPTYSNAAGLAQYHDPMNMPSWTADAPRGIPGPTVPIPIQRKHIGSFTVRRPYGDTSSGELFRNGSLAEWVNALPNGMMQQGRRWMSQSKTRNPILMNRAKYATAGSYGQTTTTLATLPGNLPASNPYGSY